MRLVMSSGVSATPKTMRKESPKAQIIGSVVTYLSWQACGLRIGRVAADTAACTEISINCQRVEAFSSCASKFLADCATKNFRGHIRTRDQKHNLGIGVIGWILKERRRRRCTGGFRNYMLVEQKNADRVE